MLELKNVTRIYQSNKGIYNCTWQAKDGDIIGIVGNNGCGKTTTFKLILQLDDYTDGDIIYNNRPINTYTKHIFGYVPEERSLYQDCYVYDLLYTICRLKNIDRKDIPKIIDEYLILFQLYIYKTKKVYELSKGNQQMIQILCAIMHNPDILILDEPFNGLDSKRRKMILLYLKQRKGITIISLHQYELVNELCNKVIHMHEGRIIDIVEVKHD